ncbi:hypothetical protein [Xylocopilactobacillus apicola]|uniref:Uncharacterized protein n=1 Tax=Xylocopilactobacillus apicola TaxID=2932184 RepID=A0AAU9DA19_9LACO|nr:hypothetical protein [Xylocopilactobacillus apicola]BDR57662.1 hypothetical protein XA3_01030 [Xylocopilactobacillus apicola]
MLDFSYLSDTDGSKPSLALKDKTIQLLEDAFLDLKEKTGIYIDPYGKTRIYPAYQKILLDYLSDNKDEEIKKLVTFFAESICQDEVIVADGD